MQSLSFKYTVPQIYFGFGFGLGFGLALLRFPFDAVAFVFFATDASNLPAETGEIIAPRNNHLFTRILQITH
jgi:hypothetical protein